MEILTSDKSGGNFNHFHSRGQLRANGEFKVAATSIKESIDENFTVEHTRNEIQVNVGIGLFL